MTSAADRLQVLFRCERYAPRPPGMTVRACLRRQLERQRGAKRGELGPPAKPFCAGECPEGRAHRAACADRTLGACPSCGAALIETTTCETCAAAREERSGAPARGHLPKRVPESVRIWTGEVPDVPFAPPATPKPATPPAPAYTFRPARRAAHAEPVLEPELLVEDPETEEPEEPPRLCACGCGRRLRADNATGFSKHCKATRYALETATTSAATAAQRPPAPPAPANQATTAEEIDMARSKLPTPRKCCGSKGTRHLKGCAGEAPSAKPRRGVELVDPAAGFQARGKPIDVLLAVIDACRAEVRRQRDEAASVVQRADAALGEVRAA